MFIKSRLTLARRRRGLLKSRLAEESGLTVRSITAYEAGTSEPLPAALERIAEVLRFPLDFFSGPSVDELRPETASFRALSRMSAATRNRALAAGQLAMELGDWIAARFNLPPSDVPDLKDFGDPEAAADALRATWNLGERPVGNMVHLLESKGVRVFSLAEDAEDVDGFSLWKAGTPYIFLNTLKSGERGRFDAAHELGHLVLHAHGSPGGRDAEVEANRFASAFLMPRGSVVAKAPWLPTVDAMIRGKRSWNVAAVALAYRLHALSLVSDWHYRTLCIQMAPFRKSEPNGIPRETSQLLEKVFAALREEGKTKADVSRELRVHPEDIDALVFGLVMTPVQGGRTGIPSGGTPGARAKLRLV